VAGKGESGGKRNQDGSNVILFLLCKIFQLRNIVCALVEMKKVDLNFIAGQVFANIVRMLLHAA
jgi:hypothetical protein